MKVTLKRRTVLKSLFWNAVGLLAGGRFAASRVTAQSPGPLYFPLIYGGPRAVLFGVRDVPIPDFSGNNRHPGVESLLTVMGENGLKFYQHAVEDTLSGADGIIATDDVVLIKVNAQWKHRGATNTDVLRGIIQRVLEHPGGFSGEVVVFENGQGRGSFNSDHNYDGDTTPAANAENQTHTFNYLVDTVFAGQPVSAFLLDSVAEVAVGADDHHTNGYRAFNPHPGKQTWKISYPCFTTTGGNRVELASGIWTGSAYASNVKLINLPVLKTHSGCGVTGALKLFYGVLSMDHADSGYHYSHIGETLGEMFAHVRAPDLNIMDAIWISHSALRGWPPATTSRQNMLLAGRDPVALDYWAAKHVLHPVSNNPNHDPDHPELYSDSNLSQYLTAAANEINACGPICGKAVVRDDDAISVLWA